MADLYPQRGVVITRLSFPLPNINKLKLNTNKSDFVNLDEFIDEVIGRDYYDTFKRVYKEFKKLINEPKNQNGISIMKQELSY